MCSTDDRWCLGASLNWTGSDIIQVNCTANPSDPSCTSNITAAENTRLANLYTDDVVSALCLYYGGGLPAHIEDSHARVPESSKERYPDDIRQNQVHALFIERSHYLRSAGECYRILARFKSRFFQPSHSKHGVDELRSFAGHFQNRKTNVCCRGIG